MEYLLGYPEGFIPPPPLGFKSFGDASGVGYWLFKRNDWRLAMRVLRDLYEARGCSGPGEFYAKRPKIKRTRTRILITQVQGLNV